MSSSESYNSESEELSEAQIFEPYIEERLEYLKTLIIDHEKRIAALENNIRVLREMMLRIENSTKD